ncbi:hypothetical protein ACFZC5_34590 [Nocardia gamkensis]
MHEPVQFERADAIGCGQDLRRTLDGGLFDTYTDSFNAVWQTGRPVEG